MKTRTALRHNALKSALCRYRRAASRSDMELGHILWPSDPGIQRPGDPVDPVTLFYNELQMSKYVADKRLQWARGLPVASFYRCSVFARFWEVKFWRSSIKCQYFNDGWTDFHKNIYLYIGLFSKTGKNWVSHRVRMMTRWSGDPDVNDDPSDPLTRWPSDPVPCLIPIHRPKCPRRALLAYLLVTSPLSLFSLINRLLDHL